MSRDSQGHFFKVEMNDLSFGLNKVAILSSNSPKANLVLRPAAASRSQLMTTNQSNHFPKNHLINQAKAILARPKVVDLKGRQVVVLVSRPVAIHLALQAEVSQVGLTALHFRNHHQKNLSTHQVAASKSQHVTTHRQNHFRKNLLISNQAKAILVRPRVADFKGRHRASHLADPLRAAVEAVTLDLAQAVLVLNRMFYASTSSS